MRPHIPEIGAVRRHQAGQAILISIMIVSVVGAALVYSVANPTLASIARDKKTAAALAEAKAALIGHAAGVNLAAGHRPGDLPCPDLNNDGLANSCGNDQSERLGRLPWKTLGLTDLRDGNGERLWYAVSNNFKDNTRTICATHNSPGCLNSDSRGTITVRNVSGTVVHDGSNPDPDGLVPSGVIAVVFAPGAVLRRQGAAASQNRTCTVGVNCTAEERCTTAPASNTPKCNPVNYLDVLSGVEDNADFVDGSATNGFIRGIIRDASNNVVVNDQLLAITYNDLMPLLEKRVVKEVYQCLTSYAAQPQNNGRYPWASKVDDSGKDSSSPSYSDKKNERFGRIPETFNETFLGLGGAVANLLCPLVPGLCMRTSWTPDCKITAPGGWWMNWKLLVFYGVAQPYQPADPAWFAGVPPGGPCGSCLRVNPPSAATDKKFVVMVAGKRLDVSGKQRRDSEGKRRDAKNFLEDDNESNADRYNDKPHTATFNDRLLYQ